MNTAMARRLALGDRVAWVGKNLLAQPGTVTRITAHQVEVLWEDETAIRYRRAQLHNLRHPKLICELHGEWSAMFIDGVQESISPARSFCRTCVEPHCSRPPPGLEYSSDVIRPGALYGCCRSKTETHTQDLPRYRARHAHWCIEAEAAEEARELAFLPAPVIGATLATCKISKSSASRN